MLDELNRRDFLKAAAIAAGPAVLPARGANEKVNIGWIGVGTRGYAGLDWMHTAAPNDVKITAICDTYQGYIARAKDRMQTIWGNVPATYLDYHDLLADKSVDAVFIMTPEHLHHDMTIAALKAGKHVYIEKPLAHTIEEGFDLVRAWQESGKIVQVGTQNRSSSLYKRAKQLIQQGAKSLFCHWRGCLSSDSEICLWHATWRRHDRFPVLRLRFRQIDANDKLLWSNERGQAIKKTVFTK